MFKSTPAFLFCKLSKELLFSSWKSTRFHIFLPKIPSDSLVGSLPRNKRIHQNSICQTDGAQASVLPPQEFSHVSPAVRLAAHLSCGCPMFTFLVCSQHGSNSDLGLNLMFATLKAKYKVLFCSYLWLTSSHAIISSDCVSHPNSDQPFTSVKIYWEVKIARGSK